ncbi:alpha/beta hydrolase [Mucisphaera sp.]|uniref:alpha/beta hydrolase n=1 Tax=Mucisphaera sp. TaxID=2913024 RepID=UPI003D0C4D06
MALLSLRYASEVLGMSRNLTAIVPDALPVPEGGFPILWLLHGLYGDDADWTRFSAIERYTQNLPLVTIMPSTDRAWYTNMAEGYPYWTHLTEELPALAARLLPVTNDPRSTYVAGLSMGGYGAFKWALTHPDRFAAAASLSGALDRANDMDPDSRNEVWLQEQTRIFGDLDAFPDSENDTVALAKRLAASGRHQPRLYQACGTKDFLYQQNLRFRDAAQAAGLNLLYEEHPGEDHTWAYWDRMIARVLDWLELPAPN